MMSFTIARLFYNCVVNLCFLKILIPDATFHKFHVESVPTVHVLKRRQGASSSPLEKRRKVIVFVVLQLFPVCGGRSSYDESTSCVVKKEEQRLEVLEVSSTLSRERTYLSEVLVVSLVALQSILSFLLFLEPWPSLASCVSPTGEER
jgi:hypothetical protein